MLFHQPEIPWSDRAVIVTTRESRLRGSVRMTSSITPFRNDANNGVKSSVNVATLQSFRNVCNCPLGKTFERFAIPDVAEFTRLLKKADSAAESACWPAA